MNIYAVDWKEKVDNGIGNDLSHANKKVHRGSELVYWM
jgi:hypothetical protein